MNNKISLNAKLEVALEIISAKIADMSNKGYTIEDKEMKELIEERNQMYFVNEKVLDKILNEYGTELRKKHEGTND